ncbi:MAG: hypothetical protein SO160_02350 [Lachnospiraceae bacterium]|nr:hypothetical protein [Lachnospiraceae bacterium]
MASMYRNTNLEEIEVDSFLEIEFLKYQTIAQKAIFIGGFLVGGTALIICTVVFHLGMLPSLGSCFPFFLLAIAFGCNYNQDLSLIKYFVLILKDPVVKFQSESTEDITYIRAKAKEFSEEQEISEQSIEEHQKTLKNLIIGICTFVVVLIITIILITVFKSDESNVHHTISSMSSMNIYHRNFIDGKGIV